MAVSLNSNIAALSAVTKLERSTQGLSRTFERLSSGLRINRPSDDAGGLAVASGLNTDSRVFTRAVMNANDGVSALSIASGSLDQLTSVLIRLKELSAQAANGAVSLSQRRSLDREAYALTQEFNRIVATTSFNNASLLSANLDDVALQLGYGTSQIQYSTSAELERRIGIGTFQTGTTSLSGASNRVITADLNGDGFVDIISARSAVNSLDIQLGNGDGTFGAITSLAGVSGIPQGVVSGDFNGDGTVDLVSTTSTGGYDFFAGNGNGTFAAAVETNISAGLLSDVRTADLNGDGRLDLVMGTGLSSANVALGNGNGTFGAPTALIASTSASSVEIGDVTGDGILDIVTTDQSPQVGIHIFVGAGNGTFALSSATLSPLGKNSDVVLGDVNHDGVMDIINTRASSNTQVFLANGDGTFQTTSFSNGGSVVGTYADLADINGDGNLDIVSTGASLIGVNFGNGDGTFGTLQTSVGNAANGTLALADFNSDGALDLVEAATAGNLGFYMSNTEATTNIARLNLTTQSEALASFSVVDAALRRVSRQQGTIGAAMSRAETATRVLINSRDNFIEAESRIRDADVAEESANLMRQQILQQAGVAVLSQANQLPALALDLLKQA